MSMKQVPKPSFRSTQMGGLFRSICGNQIAILGRSRAIWRPPLNTPRNLRTRKTCSGRVVLATAAGACIGALALITTSGRVRKTRRPFEGSGPPLGLLAFDADLAVGWCQLTPPDALPWLNRTRLLQRLDAVPVWSLSCFYVRRGYRQRGR